MSADNTATATTTAIDRPLAFIDWDEETGGYILTGPDGSTVRSTRSGDLILIGSNNGWRPKLRLTDNKIDGKKLLKNLPQTTGDLDERIAQDRANLLKGL